MDERKLSLDKRLKETKDQIIANSKDAHFAKALVDDLLVTKGQLSIQPLELNVGKKVDEFRGERFAIVKTDRGCLYHEYGGFNIFVTPNQTCLYTTLADYVDNKDVYVGLTGEEKEVFELNLSAVAYCLSVPKFCFSDVEFTYDIATKVIEFLRKAYDKAMDEPLQEETIEEDEQFKEATLGLEYIKEEIKNIEKEKEG